MCETVYCAEPESEKALLAACLNGDRDAVAALGLLTLDELTVPFHQHVAHAVRELVAAGRPFGPVEVLAYFRETGVVGYLDSHTAAMLSDLYGFMLFHGAALWNVRAILEAAWRRRSQEMAVRILSCAPTESSAAFEQLLDRERDAINDIRRRLDSLTDSPAHAHAR